MEIADLVEEKSGVWAGAREQEGRVRKRVDDDDGGDGGEIDVREERGTVRWDDGGCCSKDQECGEGGRDGTGRFEPSNAPAGECG